MLQQHTEALASEEDDDDPFAEIDSESAHSTSEESSEDESSNDEFEFPSSDEGELYSHDFTYGSVDYPIMM